MRVGRIVVPFILMVLWLQFGYLLHHLIELRLTLWHMTRLLNQANLIPSDLKIDDKLYNVLSLGSALNDGGFLDAWFRAFRPPYVSGVNTTFWGHFGNALTVILVYCSFLGGAHAAIIGMLYDNAKLAVGEVARMAQWALVFAAIVLLVLSHYQFAYSAGH